MRTVKHARSQDPSVVACQGRHRGGSRSSSRARANRWSRSSLRIRRMQALTAGSGFWPVGSRCRMISTAWARRRSRPCSRAAIEASPRYPPAALGRGHAGSVAGAGTLAGRVSGDGADGQRCVAVGSRPIKSGLGRADFSVDPRLLRRGLLENGYAALDVTGVHATAVDLLSPIHKDPPSIASWSPRHSSKGSRC